MRGSEGPGAELAGCAKAGAPDGAAQEVPGEGSYGVWEFRFTFAVSLVGCLSILGITWAGRADRDVWALLRLGACLALVVGTAGLWRLRPGDHPQPEELEEGPRR